MNLLEKIGELFKSLIQAIKDFLVMKDPDDIPPPVPEQNTPIPNVPGSKWRQGKKNYFTDADNLVIDSYVYQGGGVALTFRGKCRNITIKNSKFVDVSKGILIDRSKGATIDGLKILNTDCYNFSKSLLDCSPNSRGIFIKDCNINSNYNAKENFVMGIVIRDDCENIYIGDCDLRNFVYNSGSVREGKYLNGDAIAIEKRCTNIVLENLNIERATDGGIDTKSGGIYRNITIKECKRAFRAWSKTGVYKFEGTNRFIDCNSKSTYEWLIKEKPSFANKISKITGGCGLWIRYPEVTFEGVDTIVFDNTSTMIRVN